MNEIEKMYKNAGIKKQRECECGEHCAYYSVVSCEECDVETDMVYPPFTAEKQLELIKFLLNKSVYNDIDGDISDEIKNSKYREFDKAIAECINERWEDLREDEKQQIKEILE